MAGSRGWFTSRLWLGDEEMAKKDDDLPIARSARHGTQWHAAGPRTSRRRSLVRIALYIVGILAVFLLLRRLTYLPEEDIVRPYSAAARPGAGAASSPRFPDYGTKKPKMVPDGELPPKKQDERRPSAGDAAGGTKSQGKGAATEAAAGGYSGPLKFPALGTSLRSSGMASSTKNQNVLFAAAGLQSAAMMLPMACELAAEEGSSVHFALFSRSEITLAELLKMNGIDKQCQIRVHDARPDHSETSTETRLTVAAARAMHHLNTYLNYQAIIVDGTNTEEDYFLFGTRDHFRGTGATLIELPDRAASRVPWLTKLDAAALKEWNNVHFDILIHAPRTGTGNVKRLLRSLAAADLAGHNTPQITVELPPAVDLPLEQFLAGFTWPPSKAAGPRQNMLSLRHRIPSAKLDDEEAASRFLESFWPSNPAKSHVLVLSPHAEVTPQFFHYVKYSLLHRLYSRGGRGQDPDSLMFGISFAAPSTYLQNAKTFVPPAPINKKSTSSGTAFVWEAPSSDAMLILGERWVELHGFVSQTLQKLHAAPQLPAMLATKEIIPRYPAWLEYALQLSRLRGYFTVYPSKQTASSVVGIHTDLENVPEEHEGMKSTKAGSLEDVEDQASADFDSGSQTDVLNTFPEEGRLPTMSIMPILSWEGVESSLSAIVQTAHTYASDFRRQVGQCSGELKDVKRDKLAKDLFCHAQENSARVGGAA